ncbi:MAG: hypothetical protein KDD56_10905, partial [Bdellovibrionales bacterium]|nr:hypothetical protein [Bdellovibrionales bacterium]
TIDIAKENRGIGGAKILLAGMLADMKKQGALQITAMISPENRASMTLFRSFNFIPSKIEPDYFEKGKNYIKFVKQFE